MRTETTTFYAPFEKYIQKFLKERELVGYRTENYTYALKNFDTFSKNHYDDLTYLTKDIILEWLHPRANENYNNLSSRALIIRKFSQYINLQDKKSYVLPKGIYTFREKYNAYIFSENQINIFFSKVDEYAKNNKDRVIAINDELISLIKNLINRFHMYSNKNTYLFNHKNEKPYSRNSRIGGKR